MLSLVAAAAGLAGAGFIYFKYSRSPCALDPKKYIALTLIKIEKVTHDTRRFTFALPTSKHILGLPIGQHITLKFTNAEGKDVIRTYTPVTGDEVLGHVTFCIKIYFAGVHPRFPKGGQMSQHLESLNVGDKMLMRGPKGHMIYSHKQFTVLHPRRPDQTRKVKHLGMIAGGTGITPMLQVITAIIRDEHDTTTTMALLFANQTEEDILLREELDGLARKHPHRFRVAYTLDRPGKDWAGFSGFVNDEMIKAALPMPGDGVQILLCGPPPMLKYACYPSLEKLGYAPDQIFAF